MTKYSNSDIDISKVIVQEEFSYGPHDLQSLTVYHPVGSQHNETGYFVIYIHGGAWRDPLVHPSSLLPTLKTLLSPSTKHANILSQNIRAYVSLDYRLSPHSSYPQAAPPTTPPTQYRNAKHPDHLLDILTGIVFLQRKYGFNTRYILAGHSCGVTLALQALMRDVLLSPSALTTEEKDIVKAFKEPEVVIGLAGIYNLRLLRDNNPHPAYREFLTSAFGSDEKVWDSVSPALGLKLSREGKGGMWKEGQMLVLAHSRGDELVDEAQVDGMAGAVGGETVIDKAVTGAGAEIDGLKVRVWKDMLGQKHNEIWEGGVGMAAVMEKALVEFFNGHTSK